jgi:hypothetical protein
MFFSIPSTFVSKYISTLQKAPSSACKDLMMFAHSQHRPTQLDSNRQLAMGLALDLQCTKLVPEIAPTTPANWKPFPSPTQQQGLTSTLLLPNSVTWSIYAYTASVTNTRILIRYFLDVSEEHTSSTNEAAAGSKQQSVISSCWLLVWVILRAAAHQLRQDKHQNMR